MVYLDSQKNFGDAEKYFLEALGKEPDNFDFLYGVSTFYFGRNELKKASHFVQELINKHPQNFKARQLLSHVQQKQNQNKINRH